MTALRERDSRGILLFGELGQRKIRATSVGVIGAGGLGSAVIQHLALLGVREIVPIDPDELDESNRNRLIGARVNDPVPGSLKVAIAQRLVQEIDPEVACSPISRGLVSPEAFAAIERLDWVVGCVDHDGPRAVLNELTAAYGKPYIDLASDVPEAGIYGGRVCVSVGGQGCLECLGLLDRQAIRRYMETPEQRQLNDAIYGIPASALADRGPAVSPINGVIAALAATELMTAVTGLRPPVRVLEYRAHTSKVVVIQDVPRAECPRCSGLWNAKARADVGRYLRIPHLRT